ncbi:MAG: hypothetical protein JNL21_26140 [Myxococcales bacterium]|nr:hypothetical protein [Myxococcales bacterium]
MSQPRRRAPPLEDGEAVPGFTERAYHDELLAHGSPAPRYLRMLAPER